MRASMVSLEIAWLRHEMDRVRDVYCIVSLSDKDSELPPASRCYW
jgi:hypothetical protein